MFCLHLWGNWFDGRSDTSFVCMGRPPVRLTNQSLDGFSRTAAMREICLEQGKNHKVFLPLFVRLLLKSLECCWGCLIGLLASRKERIISAWICHVAHYHRFEQQKDATEKVIVSLSRRFKKEQFDRIRRFAMMYSAIPSMSQMRRNTAWGRMFETLSRHICRKPSWIRTPSYQILITRFQGKGPRQILESFLGEWVEIPFKCQLEIIL